MTLAGKNRGRPKDLGLPHHDARAPPGAHPPPPRPMTPPKFRWSSNHLQATCRFPIWCEAGGAKRPHNPHGGENTYAHLPVLFFLHLHRRKHINVHM